MADWLVTMTIVRGESGVKNRRLCCWASHMPSDPAITLAPPWPRKHTILHITHCQWMSESNSFSNYFWQEWTDSRAISQKNTSHWNCHECFLFSVWRWREPIARTEAFGQFCMSWSWSESRFQTECFITIVLVVWTFLIWWQYILSGRERGWPFPVPSAQLVFCHLHHCPLQRPIAPQLLAPPPYILLNNACRPYILMHSLKSSQN